LTIAESLAAAVDEEFYRFTYGDLSPGETAAAHYEREGWRDLRDPNPWFSTRAYVERYPDVERAGIAPLFHYLQTGRGEGRVAEPSQHAEAFRTRLTGGRRFIDAAHAEAAAAIELEFDAEFYLATYPDVAAALLDPLQHFVEQGWREGRDPNAFFSTKGYAEVNPDVVQAGMNPFHHYLVAGRAEGRPVRPDVGFRYEILAQLPTVAQRLAWTPPIPKWQVGDAGQLRRATGMMIRSGRRRLHVSVSHDDYTATVGGLQLSLLREADTFECRGVDHVHLYPARPLLFTDSDDADPITGVLVNGLRAGLFPASTVAEVAAGVADKPGEWTQRSLSIHSALGHNTPALVKILRAFRLERGFFWVHDFASACAGHNLLRNDVEFCGAPPPESVACTICTYGQRRRQQVADHRRLFESVGLTVVAPARVTLETWIAVNALPIEATLVHPHCRLVPREAPPPDVRERPLRIGYLGLPNPHKGWPIFRELVFRFGREHGIEFHHLGKAPQRGLPIVFTEVDAVKERPDAMAAAVEDLELDAVVIWSMCAETFCLVAYEAVAGGAMVVAPEKRGNLTQMVRDTGQGLVLDDERALFDFFESGRVFELARDKREVRYFSLEYSKMTADLVGTQWE